MNDALLPTKKIAVISLLGKQRVIAISAYHDGVLAIASMEELRGIFQTWRKTLADRIKKYQAAGLSVYIETDNPYFEDSGHVLTLDTIDEVERRTYQNIALDRYFSMQSMGDSVNDEKGQRRGNIRLGKSIQRHWINDSLINVSQDEKGRSRYDIEDGSLTGYHRALLLSVLAATHLNEFNDDSIAEFMDLIGIKTHKSPLDRMDNIFAGRFK